MWTASENKTTGTMDADYMTTTCKKKLVLLRRLYANLYV